MYSYVLTCLMFSVHVYLVGFAILYYFSHMFLCFNANIFICHQCTYHNTSNHIIFIMPPPTSWFQYNASSKNCNNISAHQSIYRHFQFNQNIRFCEELFLLSRFYVMFYTTSTNLHCTLQLYPSFVTYM